VGFSQKNCQTNHHDAPAVWWHIQKKTKKNDGSTSLMMKGSINRWVTRADSPDTLAALSSRIHPKNPPLAALPKVIVSTGVVETRWLGWQFFNG